MKYSVCVSVFGLVLAPLICACTVVHQPPGKIDSKPAEFFMELTVPNRPEIRLESPNLRLSFTEANPILSFDHHELACSLRSDSSQSQCKLWFLLPKQKQKAPDLEVNYDLQEGSIRIQCPDLQASSVSGRIESLEWTLDTMRARLAAEMTTTNGESFQLVGRMHGKFSVDCMAAFKPGDNPQNHGVGLGSPPPLNYLDWEFKSVFCQGVANRYPKASGRE